MRESVLEAYLLSIKTFSVEHGGMDCIERAAILHDLDRHITNLEMEVARIEAIKKGETPNGK